MLATTSVSFAATPIEIGPVQGQAGGKAGNGVNKPNRLSDFFNIAFPGGLFDFTLTVGPHSAVPSGVSGTMTAELLNSLSNVVSTLVVSVTGGSTNSLTNLITLSAGNYQIRWSASDVENGTIQGTASIAAVPGPEAGAGLGALTMGGVVFWMKRRRKVEVPAA